MLGRLRGCCPDHSNIGSCRRTPYAVPCLLLSCHGAATGRADLAAVGAGGGYRAHFSTVSSQVHEFDRDAPLAGYAAGVNDVAADHETPGEDGGGGTGTPYQLMED